MTSCLNDYDCSLLSTHVSSCCSSPRPVVVEMLEQKDEIDGLPEKFMNKNPDFAKYVSF